jgi:hypothetical protein
MLRQPLSFFPEYTWQKPFPTNDFKPKRPLTRTRMTIAAGMLFNGGVVFGADTEEGLGPYMKRRVHKIPTHMTQPAMITGACSNGHLMDTAVERIFDAFTPGIPETFASVGVLLGQIMNGLYGNEFKLYPMQESIAMQLLIAAKPANESKVGTWSANCNVVRRMTYPHEIVGTGELIQFIADHLHQGSESLENVKLEMVQILSAAKSRVKDVGGESYVHWLYDDGRMGAENFHFSPEIENLYEFFLTHGRSLLLATGTEAVTDEQLDEISSKFLADLKWKRARMFRRKIT